MKHSQFLKCLTILLAGIFSWEIQAQDMEQVTGELKEGDIVIFKEVKLGYVMSDGNQANLIEYSPNAINTQFVVEGNATDGYQFLVENTSNNIVGDHAPGEMYLCGGKARWDVFIRAYDPTNCTWFIIPDAEEGIYKIKSKLETGVNYIGVNYGDGAFGFPLWRDKADFSYSILPDKTDYGIFWQIFKYGSYDFYSLKLNKLCLQAEAYGESMMPTLDARDIARVAEEASILRNDPDATEEDLKEKIAELSALLLEGDSAVMAYDSLYSLLENDYNQLMDLPYPQEAKEMLTDVWGRGVDLYSSTETRRKDFETSLVEFKTATRNYHLSGLQTASENNPVEGTWMLSNPDFEAGNMGGWNTNGFVIKNTAANYSNMQGTYFVERYTGPESTLEDFYIEQVVPENLPNGKYRAIAHIVACNQNSDSTELVDGTGIRGVNLYINSTSLSVGTDDGQNFDDQGERKGGTSFTLDAIVTNNKLKIGFETRSTNANWVGIDNIQLVYLGPGILTDYESTYNEQLGKAESLVNSEMIPASLKLLANAIQNAKTADRSTVENISSVINSLNIAIDTTQVAIKKMKDFKLGSYKTLSEEYVGSEDLETKIISILADCDAILRNDTTTLAAYAGLEKDLASYLSFVKEFDQTYNFIFVTDTYTQEALSTFENTLKNIVASLNGFNASQLNKASDDLWFALAILRSSASKVGDLTNIWINNPNFDNEGTASLAASGWVNEKGFTANTVQVGVDEAFNGTYCMESWTGYGSNLENMSLSQTIKGIPNGRYTITVNAKAIQQADVNSRRKDVKGVYLFANNDSTQISTPLILDKENCELDPETGDTIVYAYFNSVNAPANTEPAAKTFSVAVVVNNHQLTIGFATKNATANWVALDKFTLTCDEIYGFVDIEEIGTDDLTYSVYSENGYIKVTGTEDFTVTTLAGLPVSASTQLVPGIYIVKVGNQTIKVVVK